MAPRRIKITAYVELSTTKVKELGSDYEDDGPAVFLNKSPTFFTVLQGFNRPDMSEFDVYFDLTGTNFKYTGGVPSGGTIKKIAVGVDYNGPVGGTNIEPAYKITGLDLSVADAAKYFNKPDPMAAFAALLTGRTDFIGSDGNDEFFGFGGNDWLRGGLGLDFLKGGNDNDVLDGEGDNDELDGGKGIDTYQFSTAASLTNFDFITKFQAGEEIYLSFVHFDEAGMSIGKGEFVEGTGAIDANDYLIWDSAAKTMYWDPDGNGATPQVGIFQTGNNANFSHRNFEIGLIDY